MEGNNCDNTSSSSSMEPKLKKRRLEFDQPQPQQNHQNTPPSPTTTTPPKRWRTEKDQQIYSSKLLQALRHVRRRQSTTGNGQEIRETADRVLAVSAKGTTRWSRAILTSPRLSFRLKKRHIKVKVSNRMRKITTTAAMMTTKKNKKKLPVVERKLRVLSQLIPGCRKVSSLNLLDEASDYISALEMQVRAMAALTELLSGSSPVSMVNS